jgi:hypothetical protein
MKGLVTLIKISLINYQSVIIINKNGNNHRLLVDLVVIGAEFGMDTMIRSPATTIGRD